MKKYLFFTIIFLELIISIDLYFKIIKKQKEVFGSISVNTISKNTLIHSSNSNLKYFYEPRPNQIIKDNFKWLPLYAKYTINLDSLNERYNYTINKELGVFRIVTLGDSFTFGLGVDTKENWTEIIEDDLNKYISKNKRCLIKKIEVINLGVHGYDIQYSVERYRLRGIKYDPDLIIWFLFDPIRIKEYLTPLIKECEAKISYKTNPINYINCWINSENKLVNKLGESEIENFLKNEFVKIFNYYKKEIVVLDFLNKHTKILKNISNLKIKNNFETAKYLTYGSKTNKYFLFDGHPNQYGHQKIAQEVMEFLLKNKLIPCQL